MTKVKRPQDFFGNVLRSKDKKYRFFFFFFLGILLLPKGLGPRVMGTFQTMGHKLALMANGYRPFALTT
jgi:hypothetical protein